MNQTILIVDDEPLLLKLLQKTLACPTIETIVAHNGIEALDILNSRNIDCIVSDVSMPKMNGIELLKQVRGQESDVTFIFFSGHGNQEIIDKDNTYKAHAFLSKPNISTLKNVVHEVLSKQQSSK